MVVSCLVQIGIHTNVRLANPEKEKILRFWTLGSEKLGKVVVSLISCGRTSNFSKNVNWWVGGGGKGEGRGILTVRPS